MIHRSHEITLSQIFRNVSLSSSIVQQAINAAGRVHKTNITITELNTTIQHTNSVISKVSKTVEFLKKVEKTFPHYMPDIVDDRKRLENALENAYYIVQEIDDIKLKNSKVKHVGNSFSVDIKGTVDIKYNIKITNSIMKLIQVLSNTKAVLNSIKKRLT